MAAKKQRRSKVSTVSGLQQALIDARLSPLGPDPKKGQEAMMARYQEFLSGTVFSDSEMPGFFTAGNPTGAKRRPRGPDPDVDSDSPEPITDQVRNSAARKYFGDSSVEFAVKSGLSPCIAEFILGELLEDRSKAGIITGEIETKLRANEGEISSVKEHKKFFEGRWRQLKAKSWVKNHNRNLKESQVLLGTLEECDFIIKSLVREGSMLKKADKLTLKLNKVMSTDKALFFFKLSSLMSDIESYKKKFPRKLEWQEKLEKLWRRKYPNLNLEPNQYIHAYMSSILGVNKQSIATRLFRYGFRIT
jgi:hypothetical protein